MNFESYQADLNATLQAFAQQLQTLAGFVLNFTVWSKGNVEGLTSDWSSPIEFTPLQSTLFKVLFALLLVTGGLIAWSWHIYGKVITEKFVKPSTLKEIEELKLSVAKLKLPKEHSPRI